MVIDAVTWHGYSNNLGLTNKVPIEPDARYEKPDWLPAVKGVLPDIDASLLNIKNGEGWRFREDLYIGTLAGPLRVNVGDWIIKGVNGEIYPRKPDVFKELYEAVEESPAHD